MKKPKIIVTSGEWQGSLACVQSLGRKGCEVYLISHNAAVLSLSHSRFCSKIIESPKEKDESAYVAFMDDLLEQESFDLIIPINDDCVRHCSRYRDRWKSRVGMLLAPQASIDTASNKRETAFMAQEHGIDIPESYFPASMEEVRALSYENIYPCVVKIPISFANNGVFEVHNRQELLDLYNKNPFRGQWPFIQRFVDGDFYGVTAVAKDGELAGQAFMFWTPKKYLTGGTHPQTYSFYDTELLPIVQKVMKALNWTGAIDFDFLKDEQGVYRMLEVNPRFSGMLNLAYKLGLDLPWDYWCVSQGRTVEPYTLCGYRQKVAYRTVFPNEVIYHLERKRLFDTAFKFLWPVNSKTNIYWDDPNLLLWQMKETYWKAQEMRKWEIPAKVTVPVTLPLAAAEGPLAVTAIDGIQKVEINTKV